LARPFASNGLLRPENKLYIKSPTIWSNVGEVLHLNTPISFHVLPEKQGNSIATISLPAPAISPECGFY
jgi:hypothetical protein